MSLRSAPIHFAIDFGTTNTVIASDRDGGVEPVALEDVMAERTGTPVVPSAVYFPGGTLPPSIGQAAVDQNLLGLGRRPSFAQGFKRHLGAESHRAVARVDAAEISARRAADGFFVGVRRSIRRQLRPARSRWLAWLEQQGWLAWLDELRERRSPLLSDLTLTAPVDADELYRRELALLGRRMGARTLRIVDEPVAAAVGYGVNVARDLTVLVLDWGGGTLDISVVRTGSAILSDGKAEVLAKSEAPVGGQDVDAWIVAKFLVPVDRYLHAWEVDAAWAAALAKEEASILGQSSFRFRDLPARPFDRGDLVTLLDQRGAYRAMERALEDALGQLSARHGLGAGAVDEALLVGGSSLLPGVDERVRRRLPSARVGEWNPFAAVATGACQFARGGPVADRIYHDYALRMADDVGRTLYYELIVPAGARYPTGPEIAERAYLPDPGRPEEVRFEICEIVRLGRAPVEWTPEPPARLTWRPTAPEDHDRAVVLSDAALRLPPSRRKPRRLRVAYRVDPSRYLRWTVWDGDRCVREDEVLGRLR